MKKKTVFEVFEGLGFKIEPTEPTIQPLRLYKSANESSNHDNYKNIHNWTIHGKFALKKSPVKKLFLRFLRF